MRLQNKDFFWIAPLGIACVFFLNIFFQSALSNNVSAAPLVLRENASLHKAVAAEVKEAEKNFVYLPLELLGTLSGRMPLAFLRNTETGAQGAYRLNDTVEGYKISGIASGKVILVKDGISKEFLLKAGSSENNSVISKEPSGILVIDKRQLVSQIVKLNEVLTKLKILPLPEGSGVNKLKGFLVENIPSGSVIEEAGVKNGDIVYSVQGKRLASMQDAWQMFNTIQNQDSFEVVLLRNDQPITLKYEIRK